MDYVPFTPKQRDEMLKAVGAKGIDDLLKQVPDAYRLTEPLNLPAGQFGLNYGGGAHAPDEFFVIKPANPKVAGLDGATASYVDLLYALAEVR